MATTKIKIYSKNKKYTGISAGVSFNKGVGETESVNKRAIAWFKQHKETYSISKPFGETEVKEEKSEDKK